MTTSPMTPRTTRNRLGQRRPADPAAAALTEVDLEVLGLEIGAAAPARLTVGEPGTRRVLYPFDGPDEALHLEQDGVLHEIAVRSVEPAIARLGPIEELVIDRLRIP